MFCYCYQFSFPNSLHEYTWRSFLSCYEFFLFPNDWIWNLFHVIFFIKPVDNCFNLINFLHRSYPYTSKLHNNYTTLCKLITFMNAYLYAFILKLHITRKFLKVILAFRNSKIYFYLGCAISFTTWFKRSNLVLNRRRSFSFISEPFKAFKTNSFNWPWTAHDNLINAHSFTVIISTPICASCRWQHSLLFAQTLSKG